MARARVPLSPLRILPLFRIGTRVCWAPTPPWIGRGVLRGSKDPARRGVSARALLLVPASVAAPGRTRQASESGIERYLSGTRLSTAPVPLEEHGDGVPLSCLGFILPPNCWSGRHKAQDRRVPTDLLSMAHTRVLYSYWSGYSRFVFLPAQYSLARDSTI